MFSQEQAGLHAVGLPLFDQGFFCPNIQVIYGNNFSNYYVRVATYSML